MGYLGDSDKFDEAFSEPLPETTEFIVLEERRNWIRIRLLSGPMCWIRRTDAIIF